MVDENFAGALGDVPLHRDLVGEGAADGAAHSLDEGAAAPVGEAGLEGDVDLHPCGAAVLGVAGEVKAVEGHLHEEGDLAHVVVRDGLERVEVEHGEAGRRRVRKS